MVGWFFEGATDLARMIEYAVQTAWSKVVSFIWLLPLTGFRATESGIDCRVIGIVTIALTFVPIALELAVAVFDLGGARFACRVFAMG